MSEHIMKRFRLRHPNLWDTRCDLEQANIFWCANEPDRALYIVKESMMSLKEKTKVHHEYIHRRKPDLILSGSSVLSDIKILYPKIILSRISHESFKT